MDSDRLNSIGLSTNEVDAVSSLIIRQKIFPTTFEYFTDEQLAKTLRQEIKKDQSNDSSSKLDHRLTLILL